MDTFNNLQRIVTETLGVTNFNINQTPERDPDSVTSVCCIAPPKLEQIRSSILTIRWDIQVSYRLGQYLYHSLPMDDFVQLWARLASQFDEPSGVGGVCGLTLTSADAVNTKGQFISVTQDRVGEKYDGYYIVDLTWNVLETRNLDFDDSAGGISPTSVIVSLWRQDLNSVDAVLDREIIVP